jgi:hypothetical protein
VILHELGHVMGNQHAQSTIMDSRLFEELDLDTSNFLIRKLSQIDQENELATIDPSLSEWTSGPEFDQLGALNTRAYNLLLGITPQVDEVLPNLVTTPFSLSLKNLEFTITEPVGTTLNLPLVAESSTVVHQGQAGIFQASRGAETWSARSHADLQTFTLNNPQGQNFRLIVERNLVPDASFAPTYSRGQVRIFIQPLDVPDTYAMQMNQAICTTTGYIYRNVCTVDDY